MSATTNPYVARDPVLSRSWNAGYLAALKDVASTLAGRGQQFTGDVRAIVLCLRSNIHDAEP